MKRIDSWPDTYTLWVNLKVPDIEFIPFEVNHHNPYFEWYYKPEARQLHYHENPIKNTAYHIAKHLKGKQPELIAAYKIFSIIRSANLFDYNEKLSGIFALYDEDLGGWWSMNAKNLFPYFDGINNHDFRREHLRKADWQTIVEISAKFWTGLANSLSIVIIPDLMDYGSAERKGYDAFTRGLAEEREYQEYLRLKEKYGDK